MNLGKYICNRKSKNEYGSGFFKKVSMDLQNELPDVKSFSITNLHYMEWFYELYPDAENLPRIEGDSRDGKNLPKAGVNSESRIFSIPWDIKN